MLQKKMREKEEVKEVQKKKELQKTEVQKKKELQQEHLKDTVTSMVLRIMATSMVMITMTRQ